VLADQDLLPSNNYCNQISVTVIMPNMRPVRQPPVPALETVTIRALYNYSNPFDAYQAMTTVVTTQSSVKVTPTWQDETRKTCYKSCEQEESSEWASDECNLPILAIPDSDRVCYDTSQE